MKINEVTEAGMETNPRPGYAKQDNPATTKYAAVALMAYSAQLRSTTLKVRQTQNRLNVFNTTIVKSCEIT